MDKPKKTPAQRRRYLKRKKIIIAPSPEYLEILEILQCEEYPPAELVDRFLTLDPLMSYIQGRLTDWRLWRIKQGYMVREEIYSEGTASEIQAAHDAAMAEMWARFRAEWKVTPGRHTVRWADAMRLSHDSEWQRKHHR